MEHLYFFPTKPADGYANPYCDNYKNAISEFFDVVDDSMLPKSLNYPLLHYACKADIFILNWIESTIFTKWGFLKVLLSLLSLFIIRTRRKKIVWMLHNIHPHQGENWASRLIENYLYCHANLIVTHSLEAAEYAMQKAKCEVTYVCHPIVDVKIDDYNKPVAPCDILIWGTVLAYKGIYELLCQECIRNSGLRIKIIGVCREKDLEENIVSKCNDRITYENRKISFPELKACIQNSRYILFPYIGGSVSSSGALMDTILMGGTPVGPKVGAFRDLCKEGVCLTYQDYPDIVNIANSNIIIEGATRSMFISNNNWRNFAQMLQIKILKTGINYVATK